MAVMQRTNSTEADALDAVLAELARKHLGVATLTPRDADALDFHELSVWKIRAAL